MRFSKRPPKVEGWFWVRSNKSPDTIKRVDKDGRLYTLELLISGEVKRINIEDWLEIHSQDNIQFAGPLMYPKDM